VVGRLMQLEHVELPGLAGCQEPLDLGWGIQATRLIKPVGTKLQEGQVSWQGACRDFRGCGAALIMAGRFLNELLAQDNLLLKSSNITMT